MLARIGQSFCFAWLQTGFQYRRQFFEQLLLPGSYSKRIYVFALLFYGGHKSLSQNGAHIFTWNNLLRSNSQLNNEWRCRRRSQIFFPTLLNWRLGRSQGFFFLQKMSCCCSSVVSRLNCARDVVLPKPFFFEKGQCLPNACNAGLKHFFLNCSTLIIVCLV